MEVIMGIFMANRIFERMICVNLGIQRFRFKDAICGVVCLVPRMECCGKIFGSELSTAYF